MYYDIKNASKIKVDQNAGFIYKHKLNDNVLDISLMRFGN